MIEFKLTKEDRLITNACAAEDSRPVLQCVHFEKGEMSAADGFILCIKKILDYKEDHEFLLNSKELSRLKDMKVLNGVQFVGEINEKTITAQGDVNVLLDKQEGTFPSYKTLIPTKEPIFKIALSRNILMKALKCFDAKEEVSLIFSFTKDTEPVLIETAYESTCQTKVALMPMFQGRKTRVGKCVTCSTDSCYECVDHSRYEAIPVTEIIKEETVNDSNSNSTNS